MTKKIIILGTVLIAFSFSTNAWRMTGDLYRTNSGALDCRPNPNSFCWSSVNPGDSYPPKEGDAVVLHFKSGDVYGEVVKSSEDGIHINTPEGKEFIQPNEDQLFNEVD